MITPPSNHRINTEPAAKMSTTQPNALNLKGAHTVREFPRLAAAGGGTTTNYFNGSKKNSQFYSTDYPIRHLRGDEVGAATNRRARQQNQNSRSKTKSRSNSPGEAEEEVEAAERNTQNWDGQIDLNQCQNTLTNRRRRNKGR